MRNMRVFRHLAAASLVVLAAAFAATAQNDREIERIENDRDIELRSWNLKLLALSAHKNKGRSDASQAQAVAQVQEDFKRLQIVNKDLVLAVPPKGELDLSFVAKSVAEIRKRAKRLNENLALPEPETPIPHAEQRVVTKAEQLKLPILRLGRLIYNFSNNPFFKEASVVDTRQTAKARAELEQIIELSNLIKEDSDRLRKTIRSVP
jgi:hypothetical protein